MLLTFGRAYLSFSLLFLRRFAYLCHIVIREFPYLFISISVWKVSLVSIPFFILFHFVHLFHFLGAKRPIDPQIQSWNKDGIVFLDYDKDVKASETRDPRDLPYSPQDINK